MSSTEEHIRDAIDFLDPKKGLVDIDRARSEMRDALNHYYIENQNSNRGDYDTNSPKNRSEDSG